MSIMRTENYAPTRPRNFKEADEVSDMALAYVGDLVRLEIPLKSVTNLRRVAEELHGLATRIDMLSRFRHEQPSATMIEVRMLVTRTNKRLEAIRARGRPKKSRTKY